jgi:hypothetical protein
VLPVLPGLRILKNDVPSAFDDDIGCCEYAGSGGKRFAAALRRSIHLAMVGFRIHVQA